MKLQGKQEVLFWPSNVLSVTASRRPRILKRMTCLFTTGLRVSFRCQLACIHFERVQFAIRNSQSATRARNYIASSVLIHCYYTTFSLRSTPPIETPACLTDPIVEHHFMSLSCTSVHYKHKYEAGRASSRVKSRPEHDRKRNSSFSI